MRLGIKKLGLLSRPNKGGEHLILLGGHCIPYCYVITLQYGIQL